MARVTVEDCVQRVPNRFDLVLLAAQRARDISAGSALTVDRDNDKNPVVALREIAEFMVSTDELDNALVQSLQKHVEVDEPEDDEFDTLASEIAVEMSEAMMGGESGDDLLAGEDGMSEDLGDAAIGDDDL